MFRKKNVEKLFLLSFIFHIFEKAILADFLMNFGLGFF